jgi:UDP-N-acetylmuramoyl-tripeptide--D-alanyl-D-alanine ligase
MIRVLPHTGVAVLNGDDTNVLWMKPHTRAKVVTFGLSEANDVHASDIVLDWPKGTRFNLHADGEIRHMAIRLMGRPMVYPILAAIAAGLAVGWTLDQILPPLANLSPTPGRLEPVRLPNGAYILRDDFKSPLETIDSAFDVLSEIPAKRRIVVLGDVSEPLGKQWQIYRKIGKRIGEIASRAIFITGKFRPYAAGAKQGGLPPSSLVHVERSVLDAVEVLRKDLDPEDVVLIKGRDTQRLDRITLALLGRTVRCDLRFCNTKVARCDHCPMLERGWGKAPSYDMKG